MAGTGGIDRVGNALKDRAGEIDLKGWYIWHAGPDLACSTLARGRRPTVLGRTRPPVPEPTCAGTQWQPCWRARDAGVAAVSTPHAIQATDGGVRTEIYVGELLPRFNALHQEDLARSGVDAGRAACQVESGRQFRRALVGLQVLTRYCEAHLGHPAPWFGGWRRLRFSCDPVIRRLL